MSEHEREIALTAGPVFLILPVAIVFALFPGASGTSTTTTAALAISAGGGRPPSPST